MSDSPAALAERLILYASDHIAAAHLMVGNMGIVDEIPVTHSQRAAVRALAAVLLLEGHEPTSLEDPSAVLRDAQRHHVGLPTACADLLALELWPVPDSRTPLGPPTELDRHGWLAVAERTVEWASLRLREGEL